MLHCAADDGAVRQEMILLPAFAKPLNAALLVNIALRSDPRLSLASRYMAPATAAAADPTSADTDAGHGSDDS